MAKGAEEFEQQTDLPDEIVTSQSISENMKNYTSSDEIINQAIGDEELDPEEGMCFDTLEDVCAYYYRYAARTGFVVKIRTTGWETRNDQRVVVNQVLHCNRDGYRTSRVKAPKRRKMMASTNCKVRCYLALDKMTGQWKIFRVEVSHSHPLNPKLSGMFSANCQLSIPSKTYQALANAAGGLANLTFTENDVRNYIGSHLRISGDETGPKELLKHFSRMKELNPNFFFEIDVDENHSIRNVFWADARCRAAWEYFGDVVTFDTTYKINRYDMSFGSFVGVNHHGMSTFLGCALLRNEDTHMFANRYMWVPVFFKDEFWTGMRSTQRSESMHSVFDKYLNNFYNVAQDFVATPEVAAILRDAMDSARHKLKEHKESKHQAAHGPNGNAQPSPTNVASSYKDTQ
ncbi:protein FAR1-RELATED SEQUENCE 5-like [Arachis duranensis]|uniref:Protein FAR1-RELATED SEQUENCE 5-like n=1 Tax=Arachis duranensis TaxID=130453 RepID=A0A6P4BKE4_ARADU|nr:protein FAR1-RELATED SEQUENCE 5-like [Arachis duranensis]